ncbi:MAG: peptide MFS transporter [Candidatus Magasanikbacteria bacterium]|jgi:POT family proton-dependent oligopeptide transporter
MERSQKMFLGHPVGLFVLFFTEMWERFSYYGMRGLLKLYMVNYLFVMLRQVLQGGPHDGAGNPDSVLGWGFIRNLLPTVDPGELTKCIATKAGALIAGDAATNLAPVAADIAQRIAEQTCAVSPWASVIYGWYTGLVYLTPVLGGYLADRYWGRRKTVVIGAILMAIGHFVMAVENLFFVALLLLIVGNGAFKPNISTQVGDLYEPGDPRREGAFTIFYMGINLGAFICNLICGTLAATVGWHYGFGAAGVGMIIGLCIYLFGRRFLAPEAPRVKQTAKSVSSHSPLTHAEWMRVGALAALCALNIVFWAVYEQQGNTMQTWVDEKTIWPVIWGFQIPSTWFQSVNPLFIFILAPLMDMYWRWQAKRKTEPTTVTKMAIGSFLLGGSFLVMVVGAMLIGDGKGSLFWPVFCTLILTIGELYLSPIGLSLVTTVSPFKIVSMMMGVWMLSSFFGNIMSGYVGQLYTTMSKEYFFLLLMALGIGTGMAMLAFNRPLRRAMNS